MSHLRAVNVNTPHQEGDVSADLFAMIAGIVCDILGYNPPACTNDLGAGGGGGCTGCGTGAGINPTCDSLCHTQNSTYVDCTDACCEADHSSHDTFCDGNLCGHCMVGVHFP